MTKRRIGRLVIQYYLSVRMSAAAAMPDLGYPEIQFPPPIVRQQPAHLHDGWDERELIRDGDTEWIVTREARDIPQTTIVWN
ncbi:MAG: hypothetical protein R3A46_04830 [Thermomicrobiales bacterium]